jgi:hypothetical protein
MTSVADKRTEYGYFLIQPRCPGHSDVGRLVFKSRIWQFATDAIIPKQAFISVS